MPKLEPNNNSYEIIQINHQLIEASANGDVEECRRLVAKDGGGANVNYVTFSGYGSTALYEAVKNNHFEIVRFLMEHGADPRCHWKIVELAAIGGVSDPKILDLLFGTTTELLEQFKGCHHLVQGRLDRAFDYFFGKDYPLVRVIGNRAFETQLLIEFFRIQNKYNAKSAIDNLPDWLFHHFNKRDGQTCIDVVDFLIRETKLSYYLVYIVLLYFRLDLRQACEIADLINSSAQRPDDTERVPEYLTYAVSRMVSNLIYSYSSEGTNQLAEKIKKFSLKDKLLVTDEWFLLIMFPLPYSRSQLQKLKFLLERCELVPNRARTLDGDTVVHLLYRNFNPRMKGYVEEAVKMVLENGLHLCSRNKSGLRVRTLIVTSSQELSASLIHPKIPRLECLAACEITQANIDTSRLPNRLQKFVNELH